MDLERLKKKIKDVGTNIAIYGDHLKEHKSELSRKYKLLDIDDVNNRLNEIEGSVKRLKKKKDKYYLEAKKILKGIKDAD